MCLTLSLTPVCHCLLVKCTHIVLSCVPYVSSHASGQLQLLGCSGYEHATLSGSIYSVRNLRLMLVKVPVVTLAFQVAQFKVQYIFPCFITYPISRKDCNRP